MIVLKYLFALLLGTIVTVGGAALIFLTSVIGTVISLITLGLGIITGITLLIVEYFDSKK